MESLSRPLHQRKISNANSFSARNAYEDVFSGSQKFPAPKFSSRVQDYSEIFGVTRASSIPVLDVSSFDQPISSADCRSSKVDYSKIFGGFNDEGVGLSYEELFTKPKGRRRTSKKKGRTLSETVFTLPGTGNSNSPDSNQSILSETSGHSFDGTKQFNMSYHKTTQQSRDGIGLTTHIAELHAVPGFTCFIDEVTPSPKKESIYANTSVTKGDVHCSMYPSEAKLNVKPNDKTLPELTKEQISEDAVKFERVCSLDRSHLNDNLVSANKVSYSYASNASPLPDVVHSSDASKSNPERSMSSTFSAYGIDDSEAVAGDTSPFPFDEELDVNSAAAASAAVLRKAIENAQESIRLAKEIMERKRDGVQSGLDQTFKGGLKLKDKRGYKIEHKGNRLHDKNARETCDGEDILFQDLDVTGRKDVTNNGENAFTGGSGVGKMHGANQGLDTEGWLSNLVKFGKHRTKGIEFENVKQNGNIMQSINSRIVNDDHTAERVEEKVSKLESAWVIHMLGKNEKSRPHYNMGSQPEGIYEDGKCVKNISKQEMGTNNDCVKRQNESQNIISNEEKEDIFEEAGNDKSTKMINNVEIYHWLENENKLKEVFGGVESNEKQKDANVGENSVKSFDDTNELKIDEKRVFDSHDREENCNSPEEGGESEGNGRISSAVGFETIQGTQSKIGQSVNDGINIIQDAVCRIFSYKDAFVHDSQDNIRANEPCEVCTDEINNKKVHTCQEAVLNEDREDMVGVSVQFSDFEEDEKTKAEEMTCEKVFNASPCVQDIREEIDFENKTKFVSEEPEAEGVFSEMFEAAGFVQFETEEAVDFENKTSVAPEGPEAEDLHSNMFRSDGLVQDGTEESEIKNSAKGTFDTHLIGDNNATDMCSSSAIAVQQSEQNCNESEPDSFLKNDKSISIHETQEYRDFKDECMSDVREYNFNTESEESQPFDLSEGKVKSVENDEEINIGQNTESEETKASLKMDSTEINISLKVEGQNIDSSLKLKIEDINQSLKTENEQKVDTKEMNPCLKKLEDEEVSPSQKVKSEGIKQSLKMESDQDIQTGDSMKSDEESRTNHNAECDQEVKTRSQMLKDEVNLNKSFKIEGKEAKETNNEKRMEEKEHLKNIDEENKREKEREKDRIAVERAIREVRERAFAEAREWAERAAVEKATAEVRNRVMAEAREKLEKSSRGTKTRVDKSSTEAKLRAERVAVERATAEARERALEKALSLKPTTGARSQASGESGLRHSFSASDLEKFDETNQESDQRRKARLERHQRIMDRAAKALAEKNMRDLLAQKEQAERNRLAEILDADIKRWASGKEGNLRALLSTLQYILVPDSGWQPISLTELIMTNAVKKAYRKAALYVHPDKLQQRGASIQQKYTCEKVFDLLKAAWNRFNSEER